MRTTITPAKLQELKNRLKVRRAALTDKEIKALRPLSTGARYDLADPSQPGFAVRINDRGQGVYCLVARFPGSTNPTRRAIADVGQIPLADARETARKWITLIKQGIDPRVEAQRQQQAELRKQEHTFASVSELWLKKHASKLRTYKAIEGAVRRELIPVLGHRPVAEVTKGEVASLLQAIIDDGRPRMAHLTFEHLKGIFEWALDQDTYGLEHLPTDRVKPRKMFGKRVLRTRLLTDVELRAFWRATERLGYPHGSLYRMLALTGCRLREVGHASWHEVNLEQRLLTIPPERFKSDATHIVPLSSTAMTIINELPRFAGGDYIFTTDGKRPISNYTIAKQRLDKLMSEELGHPVDPWVVHDLRRVVRSGLAALKVPENVAELCIGHGKKGLARIYDQHAYAGEMREALELWAAKLRDIVTPPPDNLVKGQFGDRASA
jgi:integrase